jgi:hypothetical protein
VRRHGPALLFFAATIACGARTNLEAESSGAGAAGGLGGAGGQGAVGPGPGPGPGGSGPGPGPGGSGPGPGGAGPGGAGGEGGAVEEYIAYAQTSPGHLYGMRPTFELEDLGPFPCSPLTDIARDGAGRMFAATAFTFYEIDVGAGTCTAIQSNGDYPNSLAVVPAGVLDPMDDTVVGVRGNDYVRIDKQTGALTILGEIGPGLASSGDLTFLDGALYLTVTGSGCNDCLVAIDPTSGAVVSAALPIGATQVYGVSDWSGMLYGFTADGQLRELFPGGGSTLLGIGLGQFYGATSP